MKVKNKIISVILMITIMLSALMATPLYASATDTTQGTTIKLNATCNYDDAYEVLELVNKERKEYGLHELTLDPQLTEDAMQRAAELMIYNSHTRPDGTSCFDLNEDIFAENIAMGYDSPAYVMHEWLHSSDHWANIMSDDFYSIGIGAVVHNGAPCWVQLFGIESYDEETPVPENVTKDFDIHLGDEEYPLVIDCPSSIFLGDTTQLQIKGQTRNNSCYYLLSNDDFTFSSSDDTVVSIQKDKAVPQGVGSATITATSDYATVTTQIEIIEFSPGKSRQCGENIVWDYKDGTLILTGTGNMYDYTATLENYYVDTDVPYYDGLSNVKKVVVSEGITGIGKCAFAYFKKLETVELPSTLTTIGNNAFTECGKLKTINIPEGVKVIPFGCFDSCYSLKTMSLPQSVETIDNNAFLYCVSLQYIDIPQNLSCLASCSFFGCTSLREFTIPATIDEIESGTFNQCNALTKVTILNPDVKFGVSNMFYTIADTLTIYGYNNSTAQKHCGANSITFVSLGDAPVKYTLGDVNLDGKVDVLDVTELQRHVAQSTTLDNVALSVADTNADGTINILDATHIQRFLAQLIPKL